MSGLAYITLSLYNIAQWPLTIRPDPGRGVELWSHGLGHQHDDGFSKSESRIRQSPSNGAEREILTSAFTG